MRRFLQSAILALLVLIGMLLGRELAGARQTPPTPLAAQEKLATPPGAPNTDSTQEEDEALIHANTVMSEFSAFPAHPGVFDAFERLSLPQVRALHARIKLRPRSDYRRSLLDALAHRWARLDPAHAADYARKFSTGAQVHDMTGLLAAWAHLSPEDALLEADKNPGSAKAVTLRKEALTSLAARAPTNALARLDAVVDENERTALLQRCLQTWASTDSAQAAQWIVAHPDRFTVGTDGNEAISEGIRSIAKYNMPLAIETARKLAEPLSKAALSTAIAEWGWQDPVAALDWCRANGIGADEQQDVVGTAMSRAPEKMVEKLAALDPGEDRDALATVALRSANPDQADNLFPLLSAKAQLASVPAYLISLASKKTGAGWKFATSQPEGELRERALDYSLLRLNDPPANIDERLQALPAGRSRDAAYAGLIEQKFATNAEAAAAKISAIADLKTREQIATRVFSRWQRQDREAATRWLSQTPHISTETKQKLVPAGSNSIPRNSP